MSTLTDKQMCKIVSFISKLSGDINLPIRITIKPEYGDISYLNEQLQPLSEIPKKIKIEMEIYVDQFHHVI